MAETSPAKVKVKGISQVAIVVKDVQAVAENYWSILGIGPWSIYSWESPLVHDRKYHGKPAWAREKIAAAQVGGMHLELCQPVEGNSVYQDFLIEHEEGLHHLNLLVDELDETVETLARQGFSSLQSAHVEEGAYHYINIEPIHVVWELVNSSTKGLHTLPTCYPDKEQSSPAKIKVNGINQIAIVVKDLRAAMENYWNILGIGPWQIYTLEAPLVYDRKYHGRPAWAKEKIALAQVGAAQLQLCQPIEGDSIYNDFLIENGEGLHHLNFSVDNISETVEILENDGFCSLQSARAGDAASSFIDIKPLRAIWAPVYSSEGINVQPTCYP
ncbi:VOC family protein [Chloroflexota bacterium]